MKTRSKCRGGPEEQAPSGRNRRDDMPAMERPRNERGHEKENKTPSNESVAEETNRQPTKLEEEVETRHRMKWTSQMNEDLYRCYLRITNMQEEPPGKKDKIGVRLHEALGNIHPTLKHKSVQNIVDQKRVILTTQRIPPLIMQRIRREITEELGLEEESHTAEQQNEAEQEPQDQNIEDDLGSEIIRMYERNQILYQYMDNGKRPRIPKLHIKKNTNQIIDKVNDILRTKTEQSNKMEDLHQMIYTGAITVAEKNGQKIQERREGTSRTKQYRPKPWEIRLKRQIENIRKEIGVLTQKIKTVVPTKKLAKKSLNILNKYKNTENQNIKEVLDLLKQTLAVKSNRMRRYKRSEERKEHNKLFTADQKGFYRQLNKNQNIGEDQHQTPSKDEVVDFWKKVWMSEKQHNHKAKWIKDEKQKCNKIQYMTDYCIEDQELKEVMRKAPNWKTPGPDGIQNFWLKKFHATHQQMIKHFNEIIENPENAPDFFTTAVTFLIPKTEPSSQDPKQYRPITCLPTIYKIFTAILTKKIRNHIDKNKLMAPEQKGCQKGSYGVKEVIVIDTMITEQAAKEKKDLLWAYIDYKKAYDSIPHTWLVEILSIYKIAPQIKDLLIVLMGKWKTSLMMTGNKVADINIKQGIFQGDSLSPLWFCLALNPLSNMLNKKRSGYPIGNNHKINHLIYMDDIKLISTSKEELNQLLKQTDTFTKDIKMEFGLDKCRMGEMRRGKWRANEGYLLENKDEENKVIRGMEKEETYKYLGVLQAKGIEQKKIKEELINTYKKRIGQLLKTKLTARNMITAINTYAVPVIGYSYGMVKWTNTDLEALDRLTRSKLKEHKMHHPHSSLERCYLPRSKGGRGLTNMTYLHTKLTNGIKSYFYEKAKEDPFYAAIVNNDKYTVLKLKNKQELSNESTTDRLVEEWTRKQLHGRYIHVLKQEHIDWEASCEWLKEGTLFPETEGFIVAIQDQVVATLNYRKYIIKDNTVTNDRCRICKLKPETIEHLISSCQVLAAREYLDRHNDVAKIIHSWIAWKIGYLPERTPYYSYTPEKVCETTENMLYWDRTIITDHTIPNNRPDLLLWNKTTKEAWIIDIANPAPANIKTKYNEKMSKYLPLSAELKQVWGANKVTITPIVIGAMGEIPNTLHEGLKELDLPRNLYIAMQKAVLLGTCNMVRKALNLPGSEGTKNE